MALRIDFFFDQGEQGWNESFYAPASFVGSPLEYFATVDQIAALRVNLLADHTFLRVIRISDPQSPRTSQHTYRYSQTLNTVGSRFERDVSGTAIRYMMYSANRLYRRNYFLRGLPDDWVSYVNGIPQYSRTFHNASLAYLNRIIAEAWSIRALNKELPPNGPKTNVIENITRDATTGMAMVRITAHGYTQGALVRIRGAQMVDSLLQVNRVWPVIAPTGPGRDPANTFLIDERVSDLNFGVYNGHGTCRLQILTFEPIRFIDRIEPTARDVGAVSYRRRGRARKRGPSRDQRVSDTMGAPPKLNVGGFGN